MSPPVATPEKGPKGYAFPSEGDPLLDWEVTGERIRDSRCYWLATTCPSGEPHVRPVWGAWVGGSLYFDGHPSTRWARNIARDPRVSVHLESALDVVILEGAVEDVEHADPDTAEEIIDEWNRKYGRLAPDPAARGILKLRPVRARAWSENLEDATHWELP